MIKNEIQRIDRLLDRDIEHVQILLQNKKSSDQSLINDELVYLYNEMLVLSYSLKIWLLEGLLTVTDHPEELLKTVKKQFKSIRSLLVSKDLMESKASTFHNQIQPYRRLDQAI